MRGAPMQAPSRTAEQYKGSFSYGSFFLFGGCGGLFRGRTGDHVAHGHISLVARILEELITGLLRDRESDLPRGGIRLRIVNREFVIDRVRGNAGEAFRELHILALGDTAAVGTDG